MKKTLLFALILLFAIPAAANLQPGALYQTEGTLLIKGATAQVYAEPEAGTHALHTTSGKNTLTVHGVENLADIKHLAFHPHTPTVSTDIATADIATMQSATVRLEKHGRVDAIARCDEPTPDGTCPAGWERTDLAYTDHGSYVEFTVTRFSAYAGVGVSTINAEKPIYAPGETARLSAAVLDTRGRLVSGADVTFTITAPNNTTRATGGTEGAYGIYHAIHPATGTQGTYDVAVHATGPGVNATMQSSFDVQRTYPFEIRRRAPYSTDPWDGPYTARITVTARNTSASVWNLTEYLPADVNVSAPGASITEGANRTRLTWTGLASGDAVTYRVQPALRTPDVLTMGPVLVESAPQAVWEARPWHVAVDPTDSGSFLMDGDDATGVWSTTGSAYYTEVADTDNTTYVSGQDQNDDGAGDYLFLEMENTSGIFINATAVNLTYTHRKVISGNDGIDMAYQIYESDGSTAITDECTVAGLGTAWATSTCTFSITGNNNKSVWDGALVRLRQTHQQQNSPDATAHADVSRLVVDMTYNIDNAPPTVKTALNDTPDPVYSYNDINYTITAEDPEGDNYSLTVCDSTGITNGYPGTCSGTQLCVVENVTNGTEASCLYTAQESDAGTLDAWGYVCDSGGQSCSGPNQTSTTVQSTKPSVNTITLSENPAANGTSVAVDANVTDNDAVDTVSAELLYPNGSLWQNLSMTQSGDIWNASFTTPSDPLGNYTVRIWANETNGEVNNTENESFTPYVTLGQNASVTVDGSFGEWGSLKNVSDATGDSGGGTQVDSKGRILGTESFEDEELIIGWASALTIWEYNETSDSYYQITNVTDPFPNVGRGVDAGNLTDDGAIQVVMSGNDGSSAFKVYNYTGGSLSLIERVVPANGVYAVAVGDFNTSTTTEELIYDDHSSTERDSTQVYQYRAGAFSITANLTRDPTNANYFAFIEDVDGDAGDEAGVQLDSGSVLDGMKLFEPDTFANQANYSENNTGQINDEGRFYDWNGDGLLDLASSGSSGNVTITDASTTDLMYNEHTVFDGNTAQGLALGDFNNDGCWDFASGEGGTFNNATVYFWEGDCTGTSFTRTAAIALQNQSDGDRVAVQIQSMDATDIDGDGYWEVYLAGPDDWDSDTKMWVFRYNVSNSSYYTSHAQQLQATTANDMALEAYDLDSDSTAGSSGGPAFDLVNVSLAHNSSHLYGRISVNGSLDFSGEYRLLLSTNVSTGNASSPENESLPFSYDYRVAVNDSCAVYNASGSTVGSCSSANSSDEIELSVQLSVLGLSEGDVFNASFETVSSGARNDLAPDLSSYVEYTLSAGGGGGDTTAPVISNVQNTSITISSVNISWTTDESANSSVEYGTTTSLGAMGNSSSSLVTSHELFLYGLDAETTYYYNVSSCDSAGNCNESGPYSFTTLSNKVNVTSPASGSVVDRDAQTADPDSITLVAALADGSAGVSVSFFANRTQPSVESDVLLGSNATNASGHAQLAWNGSDSTGAKLFAGNYTVWANASGYVHDRTRYYHVYGSWNVSFRNASANPNGSYSAGEDVLVEAVLSSLGPESSSLLNSSYANATANVTKPGGSVSVVQLVYRELTS